MGCLVNCFLAKLLAIRAVRIRLIVGLPVARGTHEKSITMFIVQWFHKTGTAYCMAVAAVAGAWLVEGWARTPAMVATPGRHRAFDPGTAAEKSPRHPTAKKLRCLN